MVAMYLLRSYTRRLLISVANRVFWPRRIRRGLESVGETSQSSFIGPVGQQIEWL